MRKSYPFQLSVRMEIVHQLIPEKIKTPRSSHFCVDSLCNNLLFSNAYCEQKSTSCQGTKQNAKKPVIGIKIVKVKCKLWKAYPRLMNWNIDELKTKQKIYIGISKDFFSAFWYVVKFLLFHCEFSSVVRWDMAQGF